MKKNKILFSRYKLWGDITWCLNNKNGWIRFYQVIIRWNTQPHENASKELFSVTKIAKFN